MRKLSNKTSDIPLWKKYDIVVSIIGKNGTKVAKHAKDFDIPTTTFATILKIKTIISDYEAGRSNETVGGNPDQQTLK